MTKEEIQKIKADGEVEGLTRCYESSLRSSKIHITSLYEGRVPGEIIFNNIFSKIYKELENIKQLHEEINALLKKP